MKNIFASTILMIIFIIVIDFDVVLAQNTTHYRYRGLEVCASTCHNTDSMGHQYTKWKNSAHSGSYNALATGTAKRYAKNANVTGSPQESAICLKCHITGAGLDTSYYLPTYRKEDGVTCEACHKVITMLKTIKPHESDCLVCHNNSVHKVNDFNYKERFQIIVHPMPVAMKEKSMKKK
jgi:hypothetical protein